MMERQAKTDTPPSESTEIPVEVLFDVLSSSYRRYVLAYLADVTTPAEIDDLAYHVAAWETDTDLTEVSEDAVEEAAILLHHVHLPKMAAAGLITYDVDDGVVAPDDIDSATDCIRVAK